jgi:uroporphyrinogen decarboxylase
MVEMTSRERVWAAVNHQEPDRVPFDIGGGISTTIVIEGYEKLKQKLEIPGRVQIMNRMYRLARIDESVMQQLGSDCRPLGIKSPSDWVPPHNNSEDLYTDYWGITWKKAYYPGGYYWELHNSPLNQATIEDIETYSWPNPLDPGFTAGLEDEAIVLHAGSRYAIVADSGFKNIWELGFMLRGLEQLLIDLVTYPEFVTALLTKILEINIAGTSCFLDKVGKYIHVFRTADDLATQQGLMISPKIYRTLLKPMYQKYFELIKSKTEAKIFYHSCGNVTDLLDDLIEIGVDIINPVQVTALGDIASLKARFGDRLTFWGGIDTQHVLPNGTVQEVEGEVYRRIRELGPGGGFVAASVHNIQPDVPPENIIAMAEAIRKFGKYPLS